MLNKVKLVNVLCSYFFFSLTGIHTRTTFVFGPKLANKSRRNALSKLEHEQLKINHYSELSKMSFSCEKPHVTFLEQVYKFQAPFHTSITQRSLQNVLIFRLLLKITVERLRECVSSYFLSPHGAHFDKNILLFCNMF